MNWGGKGSRPHKTPYPQTLKSSFSAVSTPPIARVGAFFSIFRELQDFHAFAPLRTQNFSRKFPYFFLFLQKKSQNLQNFGQILQDFNEISLEFHWNFTKISQNLPAVPRFRRPTHSSPLSRRKLASNCARPAAALRDYTMVLQ